MVKSDAFVLLNDENIQIHYLFILIFWVVLKNFNVNFISVLWLHWITPWKSALLTIFTSLEYRNCYHDRSLDVSCCCRWNLTLVSFKIVLQHIKYFLANWQLYSIKFNTTVCPKHSRQINLSISGSVFVHSEVKRVLV